MAKVGRKPGGEPPKCACGCGEPVVWQRGRGWGKFKHGHHIKLNNPNTGEHMRGDRNPMRNPEIAQKLSGENHWRNRPENANRAEEYRLEQTQKTGERSPYWKGGITKSSRGCLKIRVGDRYVYKHRHIMENHIGRQLDPGEVVHHLNKDVTDNRIENLKLYDSQSEHVILHNKFRKIQLNSEDAPLCACGCGKPTTLSKQYKGTRWNKYIFGHFGNVITSMFKSFNESK